MKAEVERMAQNFQTQYVAFQKKAQAGTLTQTEGEAAQKKLAEMQQQLETRKDALSEQLAKAQQDFMNEVQTRLDNYIVKYNKEKGYDFILSYSKGVGNILYANKALDITDDIVKGMNDEGNNNSGAINADNSTKK
jgi:outer membrane protein